MKQTQLNVEEIDRPLETDAVRSAFLSDQQFDEDFKPRGAIAFFVLLVLLGAVIWYGIYFLMLERI
jgi:hypothetical protein